VGLSEPDLAQRVLHYRFGASQRAKTFDLIEVD